ncbi:hypothetical protein [Thauera sp. Sel9]|uniref:hypothetical protein n=1 Tax=Thauera sp. Sel9 TaxID=2974299 RepID=UPI0021E1021B|nr:hypothetical protein [Thauera sp. Sel9]MCV2218688.1 hypothetical protein [Thauera sp. Sel9]
MTATTPFAKNVGPQRFGGDSLELAVSMVNPMSLSEADDSATRYAWWRNALGDHELASWLANFTPTHLYVGSEFCEHLLPGLRTWEKAIAHAQTVQCRVSLLTPIASPQLIRDLGKLLPSLTDGSEVIVNDWGTAHFIHERFPALHLIAGRLLCRMMKDPRLDLAAQTAAFRFDPRPLRAIFARLGIRRMEIDVPLSSDVDTFFTLPLPAGVHVPFACVAKGRMCRIGSSSIRGPERFAVGRKCRKECLKVSAQLERPGFRDTRDVYQIGNSIISKHSATMFEVVRNAIERGFISRIVVPGEPI